MAKYLDEFRLWICQLSEEARVWQISPLGRRVLVASEVWELNSQKFVIDGPEFSAIEKGSPFLEASTSLGSYGCLSVRKRHGPNKVTVLNRVWWDGFTPKFRFRCFDVAFVYFIFRATLL